MRRGRSWRYPRTGAINTSEAIFAPQGAGCAMSIGNWRRLLHGECVKGHCGSSQLIMTQIDGEELPKC